VRISSSWLSGSWWGKSESGDSPRTPNGAGFIAQKEKFEMCTSFLRCAEIANQSHLILDIDNIPATMPVSFHHPDALNSPIRFLPFRSFDELFRAEVGYRAACMGIAGPN
jgi:hypothetical protein